MLQKPIENSHGRNQLLEVHLIDDEADVKVRLPVNFVDGTQNFEIVFLRLECKLNNNLLVSSEIYSQMAEALSRGIRMNIRASLPGVEEKAFDEK